MELSELQKEIRKSEKAMTEFMQREVDRLMYMAAFTSLHLNLDATEVTEIGGVYVKRLKVAVRVEASI